MCFKLYNNILHRKVQAAIWQISASLVRIYLSIVLVNHVALMFTEYEETNMDFEHS
jgi:hypothetical protein